MLYLLGLFSFHTAKGLNTPSIYSVLSNNTMMQVQMRTPASGVQQTKLAENAFSKIGSGESALLILLRFKPENASTKSTDASSGLNRMRMQDMGEVLAMGWMAALTPPD